MGDYGGLDMEFIQTDIFRIHFCILREYETDTFLHIEGNEEIVQGNGTEVEYQPWCKGMAEQDQRASEPHLAPSSYVTFKVIHFTF